MDSRIETRKGPIRLGGAHWRSETWFESVSVANVLREALLFFVIIKFVLFFFSFIKNKSFVNCPLFED